MIVPKGLPYSIVNQPLGKKAISKMLNTCYRIPGLKPTVIFADQIMYTGFAYAARSGASVGIDDMVIPAKKAEIIEEAETEVAEIRGAVPVWSGYRRRTLQQSDRYLGCSERTRCESDDGKPVGRRRG